MALGPLGIRSSLLTGPWGPKKMKMPGLNAVSTVFNIDMTVSGVP